MPTGALSHLRVVDLTDLRGALAGRMLADLGADVVKIEPPGGDPERLTPPFAGDVVAPDRSLPFLFRNLGKRGAVIDLDDADGLGAPRRACSTRADVLLENLAAGDQTPRASRPRRGARAPPAPRARQPSPTSAATDRAPPGASSPCRRSPRRVRTGPRASRIAHRAGCPGYQAHDCAAVVAVAGALAALVARARHGHGQTVEVSVQEAAMASLAPWGDPARRLRAPLPGAAGRPTRATPTGRPSCCRSPTAGCACWP